MMGNKKVVIYGVGLMDVKTGEKATHHVTSIYVDHFYHVVKVSINHGNNVDQINLTMERAQEIGFINVKALKDYL